MTPLRQRMIEDMQLRGFSARTQECYVAAVRQLADHYHTRPDRLTEEDLRRYFLYLANEKKVARATATIALCGIKFFYEHTVQRTWTTLRLVRPPREKKLPAVTLRPDVLLLDDFGLKALRAPRTSTTSSTSGTSGHRSCSRATGTGPSGPTSSESPCWLPRLSTG